MPLADALVRSRRLGVRRLDLGDPYRWIPEAARLLRPGGELVFLRNSTLSMLCAALDGWHETSQRPQRGLHRLDWEDENTIEFQLGHGDWFRLLRERDSTYSI